MAERTDGVTAAAISALNLRAQRGLEVAERAEARIFWEGYAKALHDLANGTGAKLDAKDAAGVALPPVETCAACYATRPAGCRGGAGCVRASGVASHMHAPTDVHTNPAKTAHVDGVKTVDGEQAK